MVNKKGGKKHKKGKKSSQFETKQLRFKEDGQEYAQIIKMKGNCRFDVKCFDGKERMATMCGTMRKRRFINQDDIVLVSLREWQDAKCDIIDNYDENLVRKMKDKGLVPDSIKLDVDKQYSDDDDDNLGFVFSTDIPNSESDEEKKETSDEESSEEEIDIDEI